MDVSLLATESPADMRCRIPYLLPLLMVMASGCAHFAKIPTWTPASAQVEGVKTVAVLPFEGEWGNRVAEEVSDAFSESGRYTIVGIESLPMVRTASLNQEEPAFDQMLVAARQADIDAVLTGTIISERSDDTPEKSRSLWGISRVKSSTSNSMTVEYRLIDTRTGETLSQNRISCLEQQSRKPATDVQESLIQRCGLEVVSQLTPQHGNCSLALATCGWATRGGYAVRQGVRSAEKGNWEDAERSWNAALKANPENDAALFNLALAAASRRDFERAEELALEAIRIQHSDCYETGLEQIRLQRSQFENESQQHAGIRLSTLESVTR